MPRVLWLVFALVTCGCAPKAPAPPPLKDTTQQTTEKISPAAEKSAAAEYGPALPPAAPAAIAQSVSYPPPAAAEGVLKEETWDAYSIQGQRVGYACNRIAEVTEAGQTLVRTSSESLITMKRLGQSITQRMAISSWEKPSGEVVRFETSMYGSSGGVRAIGRVDDGRLTIKTTTTGKTQSQTLPWDPAWGGFFAPDQSLRKQPLQPGEKRTIYGLLPIFNIGGDTQFVALEHETVKLPSGEKKLLKVQSTTIIGKQSIETLLWLDDRGETLKSLVAGIQQEAYRTTREDALLNVNGGELDLMLASVAKLKQPLPNPLVTRRVTYLAKIKSGQIAGAFATGVAQQVKPLDEHSAEIRVRAVRPNSPEVIEPEFASQAELAKYTADDLASNNMIQSDAAAVVALAEKVAPGEVDPWRLACALEKFVDQTIQKKNFSQAFATAAEVAQSCEGDCTEHAVLLAALCRARKIPARVAFGLVYYPPQQGFAYHMWNEVWIADRWIPLDGTLGLGGIGADHIKLGDSDLKDGAGLATMLPVVQLLGQLELEVLEAE